MNFSKQLKKHRELNHFSQEMLAEKIYVTRQTISKWENDKSYPDIHNLVALSILFDITLDELVKGDIVSMKNMIRNNQMTKDTRNMVLFLLLAFIVGIPSFLFFGLKGSLLFGIFWLISMYFAFKIERTKKEYNIKTIKEIIAFSEGNKKLEELQQVRSTKKYFTEKFLILLFFSLIFVFLSFLIIFLTSMFISI